MPPKRKCSSKHHDYCCSLFPEEREVINKISDRKIKRSIIDGLIGKGHIFPHSTFLCNACAKFGEQCISYERDAEEGMRKKKKFSVLENFEEFIDEINNNNLSPEQLSSLTYALGSF